MDIITLALAKKQIGKDTTKAVSDYLDEHLTNPTNPPLDTSLEIAGAAADSKATGDKLSALKVELMTLETDLRAVKRKAIIRTVTIPAGTTTITDTTIDFSSDIPATARLVGVNVSLNNFYMPYVVNGAVSTWVSRMNAKSIVISNRAGVYPSYTMYATLFYV